LDPVRYVTNASSGAMGFAIADELSRRGARVTAVAGPVTIKPSSKVKIIPVTTALQMSRAVRSQLNRSDVFIATAAVSDWRFSKPTAHKMKKGTRTSMSVKLVANPDILFDAGRAKNRPVLIGFALETKNILGAMKEKLRRKNLDLIIGNTPASFGSGRINAQWLERSGRRSVLGVVGKREVARRLANWLEGKFR
jgi:phosphopantothenoylcysteine decarboxylase/phosphopantothenate--cysteine ligase